MDLIEKDGVRDEGHRQDGEDVRMGFRLRERLRQGPAWGAIGRIGRRAGVGRRLGRPFDTRQRRQNRGRQDEGGRKDAPGAPPAEGRGDRHEDEGQEHLPDILPDTLPDILPDGGGREGDAAIGVEPPPDSDEGDVGPEPLRDDPQDERPDQDDGQGQLRLEEDAADGEGRKQHGDDPVDRKDVGPFSDQEDAHARQAHHRHVQEPDVGVRQVELRPDIADAQADETMLKPTK